jgi:hypothetical protein
MRRMADRDQPVACPNCGDKNTERKRFGLFGLLKLGSKPQEAPSTQKRAAFSFLECTDGVAMSDCSASGCNIGIYTEGGGLSLDGWRSDRCQRSIVAKNSETVLKNINIK